MLLNYYINYYIKRHFTSFYHFRVHLIANFWPKICFFRLKDEIVVSDHRKQILDDYPRLESGTFFVNRSALIGVLTEKERAILTTNRNS